MNSHTQAQQDSECEAKKNCRLIRSDSLQGLRNLCDRVQGETIREWALQLIELEADCK